MGFRKYQEILIFMIEKLILNYRECGCILVGNMRKYTYSSFFFDISVLVLICWPLALLFLSFNYLNILQCCSHPPLVWLSLLITLVQVLITIHLDHCRNFLFCLPTLLPYLLTCTRLAAIGPLPQHADLFTSFPSSNNLSQDREFYCR